VCGATEIFSIALQPPAIPCARMRAKRHVADDSHILGNENIFVQLRFFAEKFINLPDDAVRFIQQGFWF